MAKISDTLSEIAISLGPNHDHNMSEVVREGGIDNGGVAEPQQPRDGTLLQRRLVDFHALVGWIW